MSNEFKKLVELTWSRYYYPDMLLHTLPIFGTCESLTLSNNYTMTWVRERQKTFWRQVSRGVFKGGCGPISALYVPYHPRAPSGKGRCLYSLVCRFNWCSFFKRVLFRCTRFFVRICLLGSFWEAGFIVHFYVRVLYFYLTLRHLTESILEPCRS